MKLFLFLLFLIFTPKPEGLASTSFIQCSEHFCSSVFSQSRLTRSWLCSWNTLRNCVTSVALMLYRMVQNSLALNRISYRTYNLCSIILLIWPNRYAKNWIRLLLTWQSSIPPALKHGLQKIILSMPIVLSNSWRLLKNPITLMIPTILTKQPMVPCQLTLHPIRRYSRCTSTVTSVMPINSVSSQMDLALSATYLSTTRIS